jgi:hypothetical protein
MAPCPSTNTGPEHGALVKHPVSRAAAGTTRFLRAQSKTAPTSTFSLLDVRNALRDAVELVDA